MKDSKLSKTLKKRINNYLLTLLKLKLSEIPRNLNTIGEVDELVEEFVFDTIDYLTLEEFVDSIQH